MSKSRISGFTLGLASAVLALALIGPARADDHHDHDRDRHYDDHHDRHDRYYDQRHVVYGPPSVIYAPPPPPPGLQFILPFYIR